MGNSSIRIEHGNYKGIKISDGFSSPGSRITTSANRCVLFNVLRNKLYIDFNNLICADFCCGSGIVGFEMLSLGAKKCFFLDCDKKKLHDIYVAINKAKFTAETICAYLPQCCFTTQRFNVIFFDPPYANNFINQTINMIAEHELLSAQGLLIVETTQNIDTSNYNILDVKILKNKAKFYFLQKKNM